MNLCMLQSLYNCVGLIRILSKNKVIVMMKDDGNVDGIFVFQINQTTAYGSCLYLYGHQKLATNSPTNIYLDHVG